MRILIDINHPAYFHAFRYCIDRLREWGHLVVITAGDKDITHRLLQAGGYVFHSTGPSPARYRLKGLQATIKILKLLWLIIRYRLTVVASFDSPYAALAGFFARCRVITFSDTEPDQLIHQITGRLSSSVVVPECFTKVIVAKQLRMKGYKELAYLHPSLFKPDREVVRQLGINPDEPYAVVRFVSFKALHDKGFNGLSQLHRIRLLSELATKTKVYLSSEEKFDGFTTPYYIEIPVLAMHHVLAFAALFAGESPTMAAEAAVLGVPSLCVTHMQLGYLTELQWRYQLVERFDATTEGQQAFIDRALALVDGPEGKASKKVLRDKMLEENINIGSFLPWFIGNYPESAHMVEKDPLHQRQFI